MKRGRAGWDREGWGSVVPWGGFRWVGLGLGGVKRGGAGWDREGWGWVVQWG